MNELLQKIGSINEIYILFGLLVAAIAGLIWVLILHIRLSNYAKSYKRLTGGRNGEDLEKMLSSYLSTVENNVSKISDFEERIDRMEKRTELSLQKVGIIRYNAFSEMGSDQSFSLAILDQHDDGFVITGIFGRNDTVTYAKPIEKGASRYPLSAEEMQAIDRAVKSGV